MSGHRFCTLPLNKSLILDLPSDARDVLVSNPGIADVVVRTSRRIYLTGVAVGQTNLFVFDGDSGRDIITDIMDNDSIVFEGNEFRAEDMVFNENEEGDVIVVRLGPTFEILATNTLSDQSFIATPAIASGELFLRSRTTLYRIRER